MSVPPLPEYLTQPPSSAASMIPPVQTAPQTLDFLALGWDDFEKLCLRLAPADREVHHQLYGKRGQNQQGIDLYVRLPEFDAYESYQCKRVREVDAALIESAVDRFFAGEWVDRTRKLFLCVAVSTVNTKVAEEIERQAKRLRERQVEFEVWGQEALSQRLKSRPDEVVDFFGPGTAQVFCPAAILGASVAGTGRAPVDLNLDLLRERGDERLGDLTLSDVFEIFGGVGPRSHGDTAASTGIVLEDDVQRLLDRLAADEPDSATRLRKLLDEGSTTAVLKWLRAHEKPQPDDTLALLVTAARIAGHEGAFADARDGYVRAAQLPDLTDRQRARQLTRAAVMTDATGDEHGFRTRLDEARALCADHPAIAIAEARASVDSDYVLRRLANVEPESEAERALLHTTRGQAHLASGDADAAAAELDLARDADTEHVAVREFEAILPLIVAQRTIAAGRRPDPDQTRQAAERFDGIRRGLDDQARWTESARIAARAAEAYALAEDHEAAKAVLDSIQRRAQLNRDAVIDVSRSALVCSAPEVVLDLLPGEQTDSMLRLLQADARLMGEVPEDRALGRASLIDLLDDRDNEIRIAAAFALTAGAAAEKDIDWSDRAADLLRPDHATGLAMMYSEHLRGQGDVEAAERELLPHAAHPRALSLLRDHAAQREDWRAAKDRSRAIMRGTPAPRDRIIDAEILWHAGDRHDAVQRFMAIIGDESMPTEIRSGGHRALISMALEDREYAEAHERARNWHDRMPDSVDAVWNLLYTLVRCHRYADAYQLVEDLNPEVTVAQEAQLLAEVLYRAAPKADAIRRIDELSRRFDRAEEPLEGLLIATALEAEQTGIEITDELGATIKEALAEFPNRFPESRVIQTVNAPKTAEELDAFLREMHQSSAEAQRDALEQIEKGTAAVNAYAAAAPSGDVVGAWDALRCLPIGFADRDVDQREFEVARTAVGAGAVWDGSSLFVAQHLSADRSDDILRALPGSLVSVTSLEDLDGAASRLPAEGSTRTTMGYDPEAGRGFMHESPADHVDRERRVILRARDLIIKLDARPGVGPQSEKNLADLVTDQDAPLAMRALVETLLLAQKEDRPVYSDDRWVRRAADEFGLRAFGTPALLGAMVAQGFIRQEQSDDARLDLAARRAWGLCLSGVELVTHGRDRGWKLTEAVIGAFKDRAAWRARPVDTAEALLPLINGAWEADPNSVGIWVQRAVHAGSEAIPELDTALFSEVLLLMALGVGKGPGERVDDRFVHALVHAVRALPIHYQTMGRDPILGAIAWVLDCVADERPELRTAVFQEAARRLPSLEQFRAIQTFVRLS